MTEEDESQDESQDDLAEVKQCPKCERICRPEDFEGGYIGTICKFCEEGLSKEEREHQIKLVLHRILSINLDSRAQGKDPLEKFNVILQSAYEQIGGASSLGTYLGQVVKMLTEVALKTKDTAMLKTVAELNLKIMNLHQKVEGEEQEEVFDEMTVEELEESQKQSVLTALRDIVKDGSNDQLMDIAAVLADRQTAGEATRTIVSGNGNH